MTGEIDVFENEIQSTQSPEIILKIQVINTYLEAEAKFKKVLLTRYKKGDVKRAERNFIPTLYSLFNWIRYEYKLDTPADEYAEIEKLILKIEKGQDLTTNEITGLYTTFVVYGNRCGLLRFASSGGFVMETM